MVETVLLMLQVIDGTEIRWIGRELDGHGLLTWDGDGVLVGAEALGAYGETLAERVPENESLAMNAFHGMEEDSDLGMTRMGVRHVMADGRWLQPEPLLALGTPEQMRLSPRSAASQYAVGNSIGYDDRSGYCPWCVPALRGAIALGTAAAAAYDAKEYWDIATSDAPVGDKVVEVAKNATVDAIFTVVGAKAAEPLLKIGGGIGTTVLKKAGILVDGACFVEGTEVETPSGFVSIETIQRGDIVVSAASTKGDEELWIELETVEENKRAVWAPRVLALACSLSIGCDVAPELPDADAVVKVYSTRDGAWSQAVGAELAVGDRFVSDGWLLLVTTDGVQTRGRVGVEDLAEADATWVSAAVLVQRERDSWLGS